jgi:preprotein translocase subunit SecG
MMPILIASFLHYVFGLSLTFTSLFLILLVLVQRGRGGGLTGALGGVGGQSAFGTKAGDLFTRITVVCAVLWIFLCMLTIVTLNGGADFQPTRPGMTGPFTRDADESEGLDGGTGNGGAGAVTPGDSPAAPPVNGSGLPATEQ